MDLSERKRRILKALAEEYIKTNEPVSSKDIADRYLNNLSSATIRNELASMEEQGIIEKTHTSSGRVPTTLGYQMFIEEILPMVKPSAKELNKIKERVVNRINNLGSMVEQTAQALSEACGLPSVVLSGITSKAKIESIKIFKITNTQCLVVVVTNEGIIKDIAIDREETSDSTCHDASAFLTKTFVGKSLCEINQELVTHNLLKFKSAIAMLISVLEKNSRTVEIATSGQGKLFESFQNDPTKAKGLYELLDNKDRLREVLSRENDEIKVKIASLNGTDCAVVSCSMKSKENKPISIAVMGPARMDYEKVIKTIKGLSKIWEE